MSRNGSGTYTLPAGNPVVTGTTISSTWANNTLSDIATALTGSVASDGQTPMTGPLAMGGNKVQGLGTPTLSTDAVTKAYADSLVGGSGAGSFTSLTVTGTTTLATSLTGLLKGSSGVVSAATAGTDYQAAITATGMLKGAGSGTVSAATAGTDYVDIATNQTFTKGQRGAVSALTDGATITPDFNASNNFSLTIGGNRTLANPTNLVAGQSGAIVITQDGSGNRTLAYGSYWKFASGVAPTLTTTASAVDVLVYYVESTTRITATMINNVS